MSRVSPVVLYGQADLASLAGRARIALREWSDAWAVPGIPAPDVRAAPWADDGLSLRCLGDAGGAWVGTSFAHGQAAVLVRTLFGSEFQAQEPLGCALAVAEAALEDMARRLLAALLGHEPGDEPAWMLDSAEVPASRLGNLSLIVLLPGVDLHMVASPVAAMAAMERPRRPTSASGPQLVARRSAVEGARLRIEAGLASTEIGLPDLLALGNGDVVLFPHAISEPVLIRTADGQPVGRALLGGRDGRRAAQLVDER